MAELPGPYEILELGDGESLTVRVERWESGEVTIYPPHARQGKVIQALRIHVGPDQKQFFPYWWDLTSKTLVAQLLPMLEAGTVGTRPVTITKHGVAPRARFTVAVS